MVRTQITTTCVSFVILSLALIAFSCLEKTPVSPPAANTPDQTSRTALPAEIAGDLWAYQDALQSPWINASWNASATFGSTERVYAGVYSIKVTLTSAWGALSLHYDNWGTAGVNPAFYSSVDFAVYGSTSGANLSVFFENDAGQPFPAVNYGAVPSGQWTLVSIPMSQ